MPLAIAFWQATIHPMPVQFILGRAGTGKTRHCFDTIEQWVRDHGLGSKVFFLLPHQATFLAERELVARTPGRSLLGVRVVSFETLVHELAGPVIAESAIIDGQGRRLLIAMAIQQCAHELAYFRGADQQPHLAARIDAAISEIEQSGQPIAAMATIIAPEPGPSQAKMADLDLICLHYARLLGDDRIDPHRQQLRLLRTIQASVLLDGALVVVDGFAGFSKLQRDILVAIAQRTARTDIALLLDDPEPSGPESLQLFYRTARTRRQLIAELKSRSIPFQTTRMQPTPYRFRNDALKAVESHFGSSPAKPLTSAGEAVRLIEMPGELEEVKGAARQIRRWQMQGIRLREIGVQCRNLASYTQWVAPVFAEHRIPCFIDQRRSLSHHPLLRFVRCLLEIACFSWKQQTVLELLKCGLLPLETHELDLLENFVLRHGITGEGWHGNWDFLSSPAGEDDTPDAQRDRREAALCTAYRAKSLMRIKPICDLATQGEQRVGDFVTPLHTLLTDRDWHIAQTLDQWIAEATPEEKQEHEQCLGQIIEVLQSTQRLLGDQRLTFGQFAAMLLASLENIEARLTPPTLDQVLFGQIDRSRSPEFRCLILLGMNEGTFPAAFSEDSIFNDVERQQLDHAGIEIQPDSARKAHDERFMAYVALTRASDELVLSRPAAGEDGRPRGRSGILARIEAILGPLAMVHEGALEQAATPAQLAGSLAAWRREAADDADPRLAALWASRGGESSLAREAFAIAQASLSYNNEPRLSHDVAIELFGGQLRCSVTRLEHFAACPFWHFAGDSLRLREREIAEVSHMDLGNAFHDVLDKLGKRIIEEKLDWSKSALQAHLDALVQQVAGELRGQLLLSSARNQYLVNVIRRMLDKVVDDQEKLQKAGSYRLAATELTFGTDEPDSLPALELRTPAGHTVMLRGRIDRVDRDCAAGRDSFLIFDYKTSQKRLSLPEVDFGLSLQLLTYVLVLRENGKQADGAMYVALMRKLNSVQEPPKAAEPAAVRSKPRGLFSREAIKGLEPGLVGHSVLYPVQIKTDRDLAKGGDCVEPEHMDAILNSLRTTLATLADAILAGNIDVAPYQLGKRSPCPYCGYRAICRMDVAQNSYRILSPAKLEADNA